MKNLLWYRSFTENYMEGLPVGNGRLAAMAVGRPEKLRIALNHEWMWRGENRFRDIEDVSANLPEVREALLAGDYEKGTHLANTYFGGPGGMSGKKNRVDPYQPAGDLWIQLNQPGEITDYRRELNMDTATVTVSFLADGSRVEEKLFVSAADGCGVLSVTSEKPVSLTLELSRIADPRCLITRASADNGFSLAGQFVYGIGFQASARVESDGSACYEDGCCHLAGARKVTVLFQVGTDAQGSAPEAEMRFPHDGRDFDALLADHVKAFAELLGPSRLTVSLPDCDLPTDERVEAFRAGQEPTLPLTYFAYGRYLMAAGSSGQLPLNLQGKWNEELQPPWECDYHLDVNIQMCYWFADILGMHRANDTLFNLCERYIPHGRQAAKMLYGCRGIYFPIQTDVWGRMTPESCGWAVWTGGAPWLAQHFYRHFEFTGDMTFLKDRAYPFLKEVAAFYEDYLFEKDGALVIAPSQSPENRFTLSGEKYPVSICINSAMDIQLVQEVLEHAIQAAQLLGVDADKAAQWKTMLTQLPPLKVGSQGQLVEWNEEFEEAEPGHRHFSNLYGLHPADLFRPGSDLEKAAERSMDLRLSHGGGHTGWSRSWTACFMARLGRAEEAWHHLTALIADFATISLLDLHPPRIFQIDGNMGGTAAICEMLMRTLGDDLYLLKARPADWLEGSVEHFSGHGGLDVSFSWRQGRLSSVTLTAPTARSITVHSGGESFVLTVEPGKTTRWEA